MTEDSQFPLENPELYTDVRTAAGRARIELRGEDGVPHHCGAPMRVKAGLMGPDYARCDSCGLTLYNAASPHVNGAIVWNESIMEKHGNAMWTSEERPWSVTKQAAAEQKD